MTISPRTVSEYIVTDPSAMIQMNSIIASAFFLGVLTLLTLTTVFFIIRNGLSRTSTRIQLVAAAILYTSTCVFFATSLPLYVNSYTWYISNEVSPLNPLSMANWSEDVQRAQSLTLTATLTINIFVGDAIVWWRACAIWPENYYVRACCVVILTATLALGSFVTYKAGIPNVGFVLNQGTNMYTADGVGSACLFLSFASNAAATAVIGYKAWEHRKLLRETLSRGAQTSRALHLLGLLVESGAGYSLLWLIIVTSDIYFIVLPNPASASIAFQSFSGIFIRGALVYLIAAYPMLIIVLVNLNRTRRDDWEGRLSSVTQDIPMHFVDPRNSATMCGVAASFGGADQETLREGEDRRSLTEHSSLSQDTELRVGMGMQTCATANV